MTHLEGYGPVAIGPANYAGQASEWARALRGHGVEAYSFGPGSSNGAFGYHVDRRFRSGRAAGMVYRPWEMARLARASSHIVIDGFLRAFVPGARGSLAFDLKLLERLGSQVAVLAHGSDVRDPDAHMARFSDSYFMHSPHEYVARLRTFSARNRRVAEGRVSFVSTPDLLLDLPWATWLPVTVDSSVWASHDEPMHRRKLRVLHMPSKRVPPIKGSEFIEPVLRELEADGVIEWISPGGVAHAEVPSLVQGVDVVVDQILSGSYGVAAVEAMAASRLVVGRMDPAVLERMPEPPPIVDADPKSLRAVILDIHGDRARYAELALRGPGFVERNHSSRVVVERFVSAWGGR